MGLDMYLIGKTQFCDLSWSPPHEKNTHAKIAAVSPIPKVSDNIDMITLEREVAYWRKANHIHQWFVENVQDGTDDCGTYNVDRDKLVELRALCDSLIDQHKQNPKAARTRAKSELPRQEGFFFGDKDYGEWYWEDLEDTVEQLDRVLAIPTEPYSISFYYHSSW